QRREAHVEVRVAHLVNAAALVVVPLQAEAIENLHLVAALEIDAAVAARLPTGVRHEGELKLGVNPAALKHAVSGGAVHEQLVFGQLPVEVVGRGAVEEDDGFLRRLGPEGRALALDFFERAHSFASVRHRGTPSFTESFSSPSSRKRAIPLSNAPDSL